ncbi:hypothetical protein ACFQY4_01145 [Catellatospora bangladeshensis]|uniref:DUF11 domain-containing protein n=1 Tax=Catellatospora bangladeshensis TaxID=310355 RepID=A0A8J3JJ02_9ACTN|nr:hypothetical protein [Catellatospora bangladeshensis]GIF81322.1 hypothetical protein Cba03nite_26710 [Catellatospora bangladeshensis]
MSHPWIAVLSTTVLGLSVPLPAAAAAPAGLALGLPAAVTATELGGEDGVVRLENTTGHDLSRVMLRLRLTGAAAGRVELASADWCDHTRTTAVCKVDRLSPGDAISIRLDLLARKNAPDGAAGGVAVSASAAGVAAATGTFPVAVGSPPFTDVSAVAEQSEVYLHTGDTAALGVVYRNSGPVPARLRVADPAATGFDDVSWTDCPDDDGDACLVELPSGASRRLGFTMRLAGDHPAEPHVAMTVEGAYDRIVTDNLAVYPVCVYDTGRCTRNVPGTHSDVFAAPSARAVTAEPAPEAVGGGFGAVNLTEPDHAPVPVAHEADAEPPYDFFDEVTGILAYSLLGLFIVGASVALGLRKRAADQS